MRLSSLVVIVALLSASVARAGEQCWCVPESKHPNEPVACDIQGCYCFDSCADGSGGGGTAPRPHLSKGQQDAFVAFVWLFMLPAGPGHMTESLLNHGQRVGPSNAEARAAWQTFMGTVKAYETLGKQIKKLRSGVATATDIGESMPDAPSNFAWNPPHLVPSTAFQCDKAWTELPLGYEWPVAGFANANELCNSCPCSANAPYRAPDPPANTCPADTFMCTGYDLCCPREFPIYNPCDQNCYAGSQFGLSPTDEGLRCNHYLKCNG